MSLTADQIKALLFHRVTRNVIFWIGFAIIPLWINWDSFGSKGNMYTDIQYYLECAFLGYTNNLVLIPMLFDRGRITQYFMVLIILVTFTNLISMFVITPLISDYLDYVNNYLLSYLYDLEDVAFFTGSFLAAALLSRLAQQKQQSSELRTLQASTELAYLKAQINPHFLFNTLNMMYSYALEGSRQLPDIMVKLSHNMRYALEEGKANYVPLVQEIQFLEDYISLQQLRLEDRVVTQFTTHGVVQSSTTLVPPLLFIVFVENAFKHAGNSLKAQNEINILLKEEKDHITFTCRNIVEKNQPTFPSLGIGLANVKKRLELLFPARYQLATRVKNDVYYVRLSIPITTAV